MSPEERRKKVLAARERVWNSQEPELRPRPGNKEWPGGDTPEAETEPERIRIDWCPRPQRPRSCNVPLDRQMNGSGRAHEAVVREELVEAVEPTDAPT